MKSLARKLTRVFPASNLPVLVIAIALGLMMCCSSALSQSDTGVGSIQGTVTDSTGAVVPGALIHVVNVGTNVATDTKSNSEGFYEVPGLFTSDYTLTVTAQGFKTYTTKIELLVSQSAVINPVMTAGAVTEQVSVTASTVQLTNPDNTDLNSTLENQRINQLPMNGRSIIYLMQETTPGLENAPGEGINTNPNRMGYGGLPAASLDWLVDGAPTSSDVRGSQLVNQGNFVDPDAVQEVRMESLNAGAQYKAPATAVLTTKSGTNSLHGSLFETARNNGLGIAKARQNPPVFSAPQYIRNEFGVSAGGPIVLPHVYHGKDKSFWFFAFERYSLNQGTSFSTKILTPQMQQGDFSLATSNNVTQVIYDPATTTNNPACPATGGANAFCRTSFTGNKIPPGEISPVAKAYYGTSVLPTTTDNPFVTPNYIGNVPTAQASPSITLRVDHAFNDTNRAFVRYTSNIGNKSLSAAATPEPASLANPAAGLPAGATTGFQSSIPEIDFFATVGYTHVFSPTLFSETVLSQNWQGLATGFPNGASADYEAQLGLPNNFGRKGLPTMGGTTLTQDFNSLSQSYYRIDQEIMVLEENLTKSMGNHQILFGGRVRHDRFEQPGGSPIDTINFSVDSTAIYDPKSGANYNPLTNTGVTDAGFFLGSASSYLVYLPPPHVHYYWNEFDGYIQDNYHVSRNLTANLGMRYEAQPGIRTAYGLTNSFDFKNDAMVLQVPTSTLISEGYTSQAIITNMQNDGVKFETPAQAGMSSNIFKDYNLIFLPRVGLAYQPFGGKHGTVIRGGFGRYTYRTSMLDTTNGNTNQFPYEASYTQSYLAANQAIDGLPNELLRYNDPVQFGEMGVSTANAVNSNATTGILPGSMSQWSIAPNWAPNYIDESNFTIEQPLKGNSVLRASWVYLHTTAVEIEEPFNLHPSNFQWEMAHGSVPPTGTVIGSNQYAATATGPYDQTTWGAMNYVAKGGWTNTNEFQATYQRIFHKGIAYQVSYVYAKTLTMGGDFNQIGSNAGYPSSIAPYSSYQGATGAVATLTSPYGTLGPSRLPPAPPTGTANWANYHALDDWAGYERDILNPPMHIMGNGIIYLPVGTGKRFLGNANRFVNELVGGFELAGDASILSQLFQPSPAAYLGATAPLKLYKHSAPITDCTSGVCHNEFLWFNGYISPTQNANTGCTSKCISGIPTDYVPYATPIDNTPGTTYFGTNEVQIQAPGLNGGAPLSVVYDRGPNGSPLQKTFLRGPTNWVADASIFKVLPITERINLRFNMDVFNLFNNQGYNNPAAGTGIEAVQPGVAGVTSYNQARQIQLTLRLDF